MDYNLYQSRHMPITQKFHDKESPFYESECTEIRKGESVTSMSRVKASTGKKIKQRGKCVTYIFALGNVGVERLVLDCMRNMALELLKERRRRNEGHNHYTALCDIDRRRSRSPRKVNYHSGVGRGRKQLPRLKFKIWKANSRERGYYSEFTDDGRGVFTQSWWSSNKRIFSMNSQDAERYVRNLAIIKWG